MSTTTVNPGRWLVMEGSFDLFGEDEQFAVERESQRIVGLADLLKSFRQDPSDPMIGLVRITIEPAAGEPIESSIFLTQRFGPDLDPEPPADE